MPVCFVKCVCYKNTGWCISTCVTYDLQYTLAYIVFFICDNDNLFLIVLSAINIEMRVESHFSSRVSKISCVKV